MNRGMLGRLVRRLRGSWDQRLVAGTALVLVVGVGAYLRLHDLDLDWFLIDQARDIRKAMGIVEGRAFPLVGPEVQGGPSHTWGPLYFYLLAVPWALSPSPVRVAAFLALLNLTAVYVTYRLGTRFFGRGVGLASAALFATYPLAVVSGRGLWNLAPLPLLVAVFLYCLLAVVIERRSVMIVPAMATLACMLQFHLSSIAGLIVLVFALILYRPPLRTPHVVLGAGTVVLLLLPYAYTQIIDGFQDLRATLLLSRATRAPVPGQELWSAMRPAFFASADLSRWLQAGFGESRAGMIGAAIQWVEGLVMLTGAAYVSVRALTGRITRVPASGRRGTRDVSAYGYGLLSLWIWTPLVLLLFKQGLRSWYYLDVLYPAPFVAGAIVLRDLVRYAAARLPPHCRPLLRATACVGILLVALANADTLRRLWELTQSAGALRLPHAVIAGGAAESSSPVVLMPIRYKEGIVRSLVTGTRFERNAFYRRVHGSAFDAVVEDGGFFFDTLSSRALPSAAPPSQAAPHYAVLGPALSRTFTTPTTPLTRIGPYTIVEYVPRLDYGSWTYSTTDVTAEAARPLEERSWAPVVVPTRGIPEASRYPYPTPFTWPAVPLLLRGNLDIPHLPHRLRLVVALRQWHEGSHRVDECRVNGAVAPVEDIFASVTPGASASETVFDLSAGLHQGRNTVTCRVSGEGNRFDVDAYELQD